MDILKVYYLWLVYHLQALCVFIFKLVSMANMQNSKKTLVGNRQKGYLKHIKCAGCQALLHDPLRLLDFHVLRPQALPGLVSLSSSKPPTVGSSKKHPLLICLAWPSFSATMINTWLHKKRTKFLSMDKWSVTLWGMQRGRHTSQVCTSIGIQVKARSDRVQAVQHDVE